MGSGMRIRTLAIGVAGALALAGCHSSTYASTKSPSARTSAGGATVIATSAAPHPATSSQSTPVKASAVASSTAPVIAALTIAQGVDNCEHAHDMTQATPPPQNPDADNLKFLSCSWPPPMWADPDGFVVITSTAHDGPGTSEASDANRADDISGPCKQYRISYEFAAQGAESAIPPFIASAGLVTGVDTAPVPWPGGVSTLDFYPKLGDVVVLRNDNDGIVSASCAS
jgi:hypothetical protein